MLFGVDNKGQPKVEWDRGAGGWARAWIMDRRGKDTDWAGCARYLNAARTEGPGQGPAGQGLDFPIYSTLNDYDILRAYVVAVSAIVSQPIPIDPEA